MNVNHHQTKRERSYFEWSDNMQITRKGKGDIAMTESELVGFFGVTWRKLNYRLQLLLKVSPLQPDERDTGELEVYVNGRLRGYALLYPLTIIIALSYQLDSMEARSTPTSQTLAYRPTLATRALMFRPFITKRLTHIQP